MKCNLFLVGMMGAGKTVWGKLLAQETEFHFLDLDEEIVAREGLSVSSIFAEKGEGYFRQQEASLLRYLGKQPKTLISCGGGTPCFFDNMAWMKAHGVVIWLNTPTAVIVERVWRAKQKRPLIARAANKEEAELIIDELTKKRLPYYQQADVEVTDVEVNLTELMAAIEAKCSKKDIKFL